LIHLNQFALQCTAGLLPPSAATWPVAAGAAKEGRRHQRIARFERGDGDFHQRSPGSRVRTEQTKSGSTAGDIARPHAVRRRLNRRVCEGSDWRWATCGFLEPPWDVHVPHIHRQGGSLCGARRRCCCGD
jgi:hypothetical protein